MNLIAHYPPHTRFFFNTWTWGYEDIIKAVARSFGAKVRSLYHSWYTVPYAMCAQVHVDRYKKAIFAGLTSDPLLDAVTTIDPYITRFHACERFNRCECVPATDREMIYVNAVECPIASWDIWRAQTYQELLEGNIVKSLVSILFSVFDTAILTSKSICRLFRSLGTRHYLNCSVLSHSSSQNVSSQTLSYLNSAEQIGHAFPPHSEIVWRQAVQTA